MKYNPTLSVANFPDVIGVLEMNTEPSIIISDPIKCAANFRFPNEIILIKNCSGKGLIFLKKPIIKNCKVKTQKQTTFNFVNVWYSFCCITSLHETETEFTLYERFIRLKHNCVYSMIASH